MWFFRSCQMFRSFARVPIFAGKFLKKTTRQKFIVIVKIFNRIIIEKIMLFHIDGIEIPKNEN